MRERILSGITTGVFLFLLPYLLTIMINGVDTALLSRSVYIEDILPVMVSMQVSKDYEEETLKCQAVIARSNFYRKIGENENVLSIWKEAAKYMDEMSLMECISLQKYQEAVKKTEGQVLTYQGKLKIVPYHEISNGKTRSGSEVFHNDEYSYLIAVDSKEDRDSDTYLNSTYIAQQQMPKEFEIVKRDSSGYVISFLADDHVLEGEAFRQGMKLSSSDFTIQKLDGRIRFLCKGKGHGLGFSQFGGNVMAKNGSNYLEILKKYFPLMEIGEILISL